MLPSVVCGKRIDIFSITDHNTAQNVAAFINFCKDKIVVPGIEIHTVEDVHILGYFRDIESCMKVSNHVRENITPFVYDPEKFGYQIVINENEEFIETVDFYLGFPTNLTIQQALEIIYKHNGLAVFAHVDRKFGVIYQLGIIPKGTEIIEVRKKETFLEYTNKGYIVLTSSDAHQPDEIGSRKTYFYDELVNVSDVLTFICERRFKTIWD
ncbi:MAG: phosphotransferase [Fervidobacterium sp.]